jgi:hypothetical protein
MNVFIKRFPVLIWCYILLILAFICTLVFRNYFSLDEPNLAWDLQKGLSETAFKTKYISEGRPFDGLITIGFQTILDTLDKLKYMRIFTVLLIFLFCIQLFLFLKKSGLGKELSFLTAILVFALPGFSVFICWAECLSLIAALLLSFLAGSLAAKAFSKYLNKPALPSGKNTAYLAGAVVLQVIAMLDYQSLALAFVLPGFITLLLAGDIPARNRFHFFLYFSFVFFLSIAVYYKVYLNLLDHYHMNMVSRGKIGDHAFAKLVWFKGILIEAGKLHLLLFKNKIISYFFCWIVTVFLIRDLIRKKFFDLFLLTAFIVMVIFPHLIIQESWGASRNFTLIQILLVLYLMIRISELIPIRSAAFVGFCGLIFIGLMSFNISEGWIKAQVQDCERLRAFVQTLPVLAGNDLEIEAVPPAWNFHEKNSPLKAYFDEFNDPLFLRRWPIEPGIKMLYLQQHPGIPVADIEKHIHLKIIPSINAYSPIEAGKTYRLDLSN